MDQLSFKRHRFPPHIIPHAIWLHARLTVSLRDTEEMMAERGVDISYETVRRRFIKFCHAVERFKIDDDQLARILRRGPALGDDEGNRLADMRRTPVPESISRENDAVPSC